MFSENGIKSETIHGTLDLKWNIIHKIKQNKYYFYLYTQPEGAIIIPKRIFNNKNEINNFFSFLNIHVSKTKN